MKNKIETLNVIYNEDCIEGLKKLPSESVDLIIADPPYFKIIGQSWDYKLSTFEEYEKLIKSQDKLNNKLEQLVKTKILTRYFFTAEDGKTKLTDSGIAYIAGFEANNKVEKYSEWILPRREMWHSPISDSYIYIPKK